MSVTLTQETGFSRDAVVALSELKNEPTWLRDARLQAWDTYESLPMPARTDEEWRRTDFRALKFGHLHPFQPNGHKEPSLEALLSGFEKLTDYQFGKKHIHHPFCSVGGLKPYSHGSDGKGNEMIAVNVRCVEGLDLRGITPNWFDGASL